MKTNTEQPGIDLDKLEALAKAATPQNFDSAQIQNQGHIECPTCDGSGEVELTADYCNYDGRAIGVQFYGIGPEYRAAEAFYRAANPQAVQQLIALARAALTQQAEAPQAGAADTTASASIDTPEYQQLLHAYCLAKRFGTDADEQAAYVALRDHIDSRAPVAAQQANKQANVLPPFAAPAGLRDAILSAAIKCGHSITDGVVKLYANPKAPGNALSQLADRLEEELASRCRAEGGNTIANSPEFEGISGSDIAAKAPAAQADWRDAALQAAWPYIKDIDSIAKLFDGPASTPEASQQAPVVREVPDGYVLVPKVPTGAMLDAAARELSMNDESAGAAESDLEYQADAHTAWDAMLAASTATVTAPAQSDELSKAFMTLESSGGEGRTIVLKFNQREDAYVVHDYLLKAGSQDYRVAPAAQQAAPILLNAEELAALRRFDECALDGEGYDVPKDMMQRLAEIGVVRRKSGAYYEATDFGQHVLGNAPAASTDIKELVSRFLGWSMPHSLSARIAPNVTKPIGTHLMNADEARAMFEYCLAGAAPATTGTVEGGAMGDDLKGAEHG